MQTEFINFESNNYFTLETINEVVSKVKEYADKKGFKEVRLVEVEDNTWSDPVNQRFDITIRYHDNMPGSIEMQRKLLMLKGEVIDGEEFHKRRKEFYS